MQDSILPALQNALRVVSLSVLPLKNPIPVVNDMPVSLLQNHAK
jgi:hypothetical protein